MPIQHIGGGELHQILLAQALTPLYEVDLLHHAQGLTAERLGDYYGLTLEGLEVRYADPVPTVWPYAADERDRGARGLAAHRRLTEPYDLFVNVVCAPPIRSYARHGLLVVLFPFVGRGDAWPWRSNGSPPPLLKRLVRNAHYARLWRGVFASYERCIANSAFTARWTKERWGIEASVIYPPVRARFVQRPKSNTILSVGRFSQLGARKRQLDMVQAFTSAYDTRFEGWEYVCLGGLSDDPGNRRYFEEVREAARGYPVRVVANAPDGMIKEAYESASVFWHAAGYGEDDALYPERTEHFGMTTVEAMAAGCVPVVIRKGGQPEIVEHGSSGFLWQTLDELVRHTHQLTSRPELRASMAAAARARARVFTDMDVFRAQVQRIAAFDGAFVDP